MDTPKVLLACLCFVMCCYGLPNGEKNPKFSIFQIAKFQNGPCIGDGTRNGTCYTESECSALGGANGGSCADGFGVCCIKKITSGEGSAVNGSFIVAEAASVTAGSVYTYSVCPSGPEICRIRFDFTDFTLAAPVTAPGTLAAANAGILAIQGPSIGDCTEDQFSITNPVSSGTPVICGTNKGQHMIVDSDGVSCSNVNIAIGSSTFTRSWDIKVTQFECGDEMGGPAGCLQYFTTPTGTIRSFNFPELTAGTAVPVSVVHLSNQHYKACVRKPLGANRICYPPCTSIDPSTGQSSFGVSISPNAAARSGSNSDCLTDYIGILGGQTSANAAAGTLSTLSRFCGRELIPTRNTAWSANQAAVCTATVPFELTVNFDDKEVMTNGGDAMTAEAAANPGGILGFSLCYTTA